MGISDNVKHLRKNVLGLTREKFGERLGVSAGEINNIERGVLARPELKEPLFRLMCSEFNINYEWLMTGEGAMRPETREDATERFANEHGLTHYAKKVLYCYLSLDEGKREAVNIFLQGFVESCSEKEAAPPLS